MPLPKDGAPNAGFCADPNPLLLELPKLGTVALVLETPKDGVEP